MSTYGETQEEALDQTREAIIGHIEVAGAQGLSIPTADLVELTEVEIATGRTACRA